MKGIGEVRAHFFISEIPRLFYGISKFAVLSTSKSHAKITVTLSYQSPSIFMKCYSSLRIIQYFIYIHLIPHGKIIYTEWGMVLQHTMTYEGEGVVEYHFDK